VFGLMTAFGTAGGLVETACHCLVINLQGARNQALRSDCMMIDYRRHRSNGE
jgi:hypothetical protein